MKKPKVYIILLVCLLCFCPGIFALSQAETADSADLVHRGISLHEEITELLPNHADKVDSLARYMLQLFKGRGDSLEALAWFDLGEAAYYLGDYARAGDYYQQSIDLFHPLKNYPRLITLYNNLGLCFYFNNHYKDALVAYTQSAELARKHGKPIDFARGIHNLALVHDRAGNHESAYTHFENALNILDSLDEPYVEASVCNDYASFLVNRGKSAQADRLYRRALKIFRQQNDSKEMNAVLVNLGSLSLASGEFKKAESYFNDARSYFERTRDHRSLVSLYSLLGDLYFQKGEGVKSIPYYNRVETLAQNMSLTYLRHKNLYSLYHALKESGRYPEALETIETYNKLKDSLTAESKSYAASAAGNQLERDLMQNELELHRARARERNWIILSLSLTVLLALTLLLVYIRHQRLVREREKSRLESRILHMQMNPHFIFNALNAVQGYILNDDKGKAVDFVHDLALLMRRTLEASSSELITLAEEISFVKSYISVQCRRFTQKISCNVLSDIDTTEASRLMLPSMLTQPIIENVFEHSEFERHKVPRLVVSYKKTRDALEVTIEDNGMGFDPSQLAASKSAHKPCATDIINERLALLKKMYKGGEAEMEITNLATLGLQGTRVRFWLPLIFAKDQKTKATNS